MEQFNEEDSFGNDQFVEQSKEQTRKEPNHVLWLLLILVGFAAIVVLLIVLRII